MFAGETVAITRPDKFSKQRMRLKRLRFELGMELATEKKWVAGNLHNLDVGRVRSCSRDAQARPGQDRFILAIELVAMAMALADLCLSVRACCQGIRLQHAGPRAQSHGAAHLLYACQFAQFVNHAMRRSRVEFAGIRAIQSADVACVFDPGGLHAKTDAKVGDLSFASIANRIQHPFDPALTED